MIFFKIPIECVRVHDKPLSFNLILKNNHTGIKNLACAKNDIMDADRLKGIEERHSKGEVLLLPEENLDAFDAVFSGKQKILDANKEQIELKELQDKNLEQYKKDFPEERNLFENLLQTARMEDTLGPMVKAARAQIDCFSLSESPEQSMLIGYCSFCLSRSGVMPAGCAFAYFLAKKLDIKDPIELMEVVAAYSLRELGHAYLRLGRAKKEDPDFSKYPMFSQHIISMSGAPFSKNVSRMILEHRETPSGGGFPRGKTEQQTAFNSYIVGAVHLLFEIYYKEMNGRFIDKAITKAANSGAVHPRVESALHALRR